MRDFGNFIGGFGDFETMMHDTELEDFIVRIYTEDGYAMFKNILGWTMLSDDVMLTMIDAEGYDDDDELFDSIDHQGVEFRSLKQILKDGGIDIVPRDQYDFGEDEDEDECEGDCPKCFCDECPNCKDDDDDDDDECNDEPWECHCGNINGSDELFCLKCGCIEGRIEDDCDFKQFIEVKKAADEMVENLKNIAGLTGKEIPEFTPEALLEMMKEFNKEMTAVGDILH